MAASNRFNLMLIDKNRQPKKDLPATSDPYELLDNNGQPKRVLPAVLRTSDQLIVALGSALSRAEELKDKLRPDSDLVPVAYIQYINYRQLFELPVSPEEFQVAEKMLKALGLDQSGPAKPPQGMEHNVMQELGKDLEGVDDFRNKCLAFHAFVYPKMSFEDLAPQLDK
ncbi:Protein of unknown function [Pyronema omphalodes CBS 100304]|uniref:Uncharacterized protein n=1 Tax=Pyronema omphalodes (strain CBS 100304) TaxID=1076935 RepID=U4LLN8_PYROM|nr:Protein of unknown function [Pyronema omphalodes CBS 100304]